MAGQPKFFKLYYNDLRLIGKYMVTDSATGEVKEISINQNAVLVYDRIKSFRKEGKPFLMTDVQIAEQLNFSEATASSCIGKLKRLGLIRVWFERPQDGRVRARRYINYQVEREVELLAMRERLPFEMIDLTQDRTDGGSCP